MLGICGADTGRLRSLPQFKVLGPVVRPVTVQVMNGLSWEQPAPDLELHDMPVLKSIFAVYADRDIAGATDVPAALPVIAPRPSAYGGADLCPDLRRDTAAPHRSGDLRPGLWGVFTASEPAHSVLNPVAVGQFHGGNFTMTKEYPSGR